MSQTIVQPPPSAPERPPATGRDGRPAPVTTRSAARRDDWIFLLVVVASLSLVVALVAVGFGARAIDEAKHGGASGGRASAPGPATAEIELSEFAVAPAEVTVAPGGSLQVMNMGSIAHNLAVRGSELATPMIEPGGRATLVLEHLAPGTYELFCNVAGHEAAGMKATLHVASGGAPPSATDATAPASATLPSTADATIDFNAMPGPAWHPFDPTLRPVDGATVHDVTFHATEQVMEVAPGVRQQVWTFNGQVPGPVLRGHVGDVFNVTLVNDGAMGHSIDFHASKVDPGTAMRTLQPGQSLVYQFKADYAGIWMYHCGTPPALHHIGNGMYGAVVIDPPGLTPVDHEYVMVQSELYVGPQDQPGDLAKMQAVDPDAVVFNGYVNQYKFSPIRVEPGERVRIWVLDAGPNENSSFHIVGTIFDTVFKEGRYELRPDATRGGAQTLDLQPAQGGFVEFTLAETGQYPIVTHKFANVGKGALGIIQAGEAKGGSH